MAQITRNSHTFSAVIDTKTLPDEPVHVTLRGTDGAGNTRYWNNNSANRQHVFIVDNTAPNDVNIVIDNDVNPSEAIISAKDIHLNRIDVSLWKEGETGYIAFPGEWINQLAQTLARTMQTN